MLKAFISEYKYLKSSPNICSGAIARTALPYALA